ERTRRLFAQRRGRVLWLAVPSRRRAVAQVHVPRVPVAKHVVHVVRRVVVATPDRVRTGVIITRLVEARESPVAGSTPARARVAVVALSEGLVVGKLDLCPGTTGDPGRDGGVVHADGEWSQARRLQEARTGSGRGEHGER